MLTLVSWSWHIATAHVLSNRVGPARIAADFSSPLQLLRCCWIENKASSDCGGLQSMRVVSCARASTEFTAKWSGTVIMTRCFAPMQWDLRCHYFKPDPLVCLLGWFSCKFFIPPFPFLCVFNSRVIQLLLQWTISRWSTWPWRDKFDWDKLAVIKTFHISQKKEYFLTSGVKSRRIFVILFYDIWSHVVFI